MSVLLPQLNSINFNPRSPCGERPWLVDSHGMLCSNFNPRSPCGERHARSVGTTRRTRFQPTLPVRGATEKLAGVNRREEISTHAPRAGSDICGPGRPSLVPDFNPRSPCGERQQGGRIEALDILFQPTLPVRGATCKATTIRPPRRYFNPRSPCGERLASVVANKPHVKISTHAPRAGSDSQWHPAIAATS